LSERQASATAPKAAEPATIEVSVVMPCLNGTDTLATWIRKIQQAMQSAASSARPSWRTMAVPTNLDAHAWPGHHDGNLALGCTSTPVAPGLHVLPRSAAICTTYARMGRHWIPDIVAPGRRP
jgi:hypothetical protein